MHDASVHFLGYRRVRAERLPACFGPGGRLRASLCALVAPGLCAAATDFPLAEATDIALSVLWTQPLYTFAGLILASSIITLLVARLLRRDRQTGQVRRAAVNDHDSSEHLDVGRALYESERRCGDTFEHAAVGIAHVGLDGSWLRINQKLLDILGYSREELQALTFQDITHPEDVATDLALLRQCLAGEINDYRMEKRYIRKDRGLVWAELTVALVRCEDGTPDYFIAVIENIDQRKHDLAALEQANSLYQELIEHMRDGVAIYEAVDDGADFVFTAFNPAAARSARISADEIIGRRVRDVFPGVEAIGLFAVFRRVYRSGQAESHSTTRYEDDRIAMWVENYVFKLPGGELVAVFADVSEQKSAEQALLHSQATLQQMAYYDALTGLPNRRLLLDRLGQAMAVADRSGTSLAVCYLDLDDFKPVNDQLGHATGDALLQAVAQRLRTVIRVSDTVSRWGGDEFTLLLTGLGGMAEGEESVTRILRAVAAPYQVGEHRLTLSASIGVAMYPFHQVNGDTLLRSADHAMYMAKERGRNGYQFVDPATDSFGSNRKDWTARIAKALQTDEFCLLYQPIVNMREGGVAGMEALVRWQHPDRGLLLPSAFLPMIEGSELIRDLDRFVLQQAIADVADWFQAGLSPRLHVNLSAHSLLAEDFIDGVRAAFENTPAVTGDQVRLEILETAALQDLEAVTGVIRRCNELGLQFALDDFGTGYSSLTYFRHLPADTLKIDQSFVRNMLRDQSDLRIVESVIGMARAFDRSVVAEGVESEEHGTMLLRLGCDLGQGYGIARPMPPEQVAQWLKNYQHPRQWRSATARVWRPEDLPLLTMEAEHRGWVDQLIAHARSDGEDRPMSTVDRLCRFGRWYHGDGMRRYGHMDAFKDIDALHQRVHQIGEGLLQMRQNGDPLPDEILEQLRMASNALIDRLTMLQNAVIESRDATESDRPDRPHGRPRSEDDKPDDLAAPDWASPT
jgi:diguanylate cyclase (GGDEF)-like protein/PAS domain S-box-containing protein